MKLTHPVAIKSAALLSSFVVKAWFSTLSHRITFDEPLVQPALNPAPSLYLFWHEMMLLPAYVYASTRIPVLVSEHRDGELIAQVMRMMGGQAIRGSTRRNGEVALRAMIRRGRFGHVAMTPDGPRGPRRQVQIGSIYLASRAKLRIVPCGFAFGNNWRVRSWDRMALPMPFENARGIFGQALDVPLDPHRRDLEPFRLRVQQAMDDCQRRAEEEVCRSSGTERSIVCPSGSPLRRRRQETVGDESMNEPSPLD